MLRCAVFHELLTRDEMARADRLAVEHGVASLTLMENAGRAVAQAAADRVRVGETILVVCGPGNNGGDGFVAARVLRQRGFQVRLALLGQRDRLKGDAAEMAARWGDAIEPLTPATVEGADAIIDALFGAGLSRPLEGMAGDVVAAINATRRPVVAVDVPSGLDGDTGSSDGPVVEAQVTVTFMRLKPGHLLLPGRRLCGEVRLADIGIPEDVLDSIKPRTFANRPSLWLADFPRPRADGHKYDRGHAVVVSGPADSTGAARLGARGALRAGAGLVTLVGSAAATAVNATHLTAVMLRALGDDSALADFLADRRRNAALLGPGAGVGAATAASALTLLAGPAAVVLDADALTSFAADAGETVRAAGLGFVLRGSEVRPTADRLFSAIKARAAPVVLTPHEGEFKRLFGDAGGGGKLDRARAAAQVSGAVVVLKGADTVIAAPDGRAAINDNAPPWLATAGAGDVLAGIVLGLLAQHMPALPAACAAVWLHGECAEQFGPGLIAEDLPETLPRVLRQLLASPRAGG
jgi:ADP-dependent NAD(P)H-hydrate dehydratase / NAD(P)H-hydrate epimerase